MIISRNSYLQKLVHAQQNGMVKVITGIRRCGKSFLLFTLFYNYLKEHGVDDGHIIQMDFEDYENKEYRNPNVFYKYAKERIKDDNRYFMLLDEVQKLDQFEDVLNGFLRRSNVDIYVTGSNAKFLSQDIITEFRGRGDQIHMYPLSFGEFMSCYRNTKEEGWEEYLNFGGLPLVVNEESKEKKVEILQNLLEETYLSDILTRNSIKNSTELEDLFNILASNVGALTNPQKLSDTFKSVLKSSITPPTIKNYIDYFCESFLIEKANRYDVKGRKYIGTPLKYYFMDLGLRNAKLNFRQNETSHLMENAVYNEMRRRGYCVDVGVVTINSKDKNGKSQRTQLEVDFVCNKGSKRYYIQVAQNMATEAKQKQEINSLLRINDSFKKIVIVGDHTLSFQDDNGIAYINIYDFMLNDNSLEY